MNLYDRDTPGPYTPPRPPNPRAPKRMPRWAKFVVLAAAVPMAAAGAVVAVLIGPGLAQQTADRSPVISTYDPGLYTPEVKPTATVKRTPQAHKPSPAMLPRDGLLVVGRQIRPGVYQTRVPLVMYFGRETPGYCYVSRLNTATPSLGEVRTSYDHVPTGPIIADAQYQEVGELVTLRVLPTDAAVEVDCDGAIWKRVR